ncbi:MULTISPECIES: fimbrillin family protein [Parabacteroides]|jgi:hypothetical protein|uniref:fimbrillin family protein n=1 Tax=Parabacteroides TaxID=375288 RepID=UPI0006176597|nr:MULTISPECIES: fimbrillin family protein [Parabacteroides]KKB51511.1 hypothetical protein HMPREF1212_02241 [Parabacteroides sp. HGS0025]RGP16427.1 fimbrillin family protein [Parabacteroides gordonii]
MNRTILFKTFLLVTCMGCTGNLPENNGNALQLSAVSVDEGSISKGGTGTVTSIDNVCVYVAKDDYKPYDETAPSLVFTNKAGNWTSDKAVIMQNGVNAKVYGAFPADAGITNDNGNLKVDVEVLKGGDNTLDFLGSQQSDYLYSAEVSASYSARTISLTMKHAMAKVSFRIVKGADVSETLLLKQVKILSNTNLLQAGSGYMLLNTTTGAATLNGLASTSQITMDSGSSNRTELQINQSSPNVTCLVAPMSTSESVLSFSITVAKEGDTLERTFTTSSISPAVKWEAGFHYTYRITVNKMSGDVDGVLIEDWQNDASQNTSVGI